MMRYWSGALVLREAEGPGLAQPGEEMALGRTC